MKIGKFFFKVTRNINWFFVIPTILIKHYRDYKTKEIMIYNLSINFLNYELFLMRI